MKRRNPHDIVAGDILQDLVTGDLITYMGSRTKGTGRYRCLTAKGIVNISPSEVDSFVFKRFTVITSQGIKVREPEQKP